MEQYYNKKVRPAGFRPGEFVYRRNEASRVEDQGKLGPKWEGPYRVTEAFENGSYKLQTIEDKIVPRTWHAINLPPPDMKNPQTTKSQGLVNQSEGPSRSGYGRPTDNLTSARGLINHIEGLDPPDMINSRTAKSQGLIVNHAKGSSPFGHNQSKPITGINPAEQDGSARKGYHNNDHKVAKMRI
ncbi:hypothetical protein Tco_0685422 [Tanacetum coccineum]